MAEMKPPTSDLASAAVAEALAPSDRPAKHHDRPPREPLPRYDDNEPLPPYDDAKLLKGKKGNVLRPLRPDDVERNLQVEKLEAEMVKQQARMAEIKALQQTMRARGPNPEQAEHRRRKDELHTAWNTTLVRGHRSNGQITVISLAHLSITTTCAQKQKMAIREEFNRSNIEREVLRSDLRE